MKFALTLVPIMAAMVMGSTYPHEPPSYDNEITTTMTTYTTTTTCPVEETVTEGGG
jgi:hypothetical protein